MYNTQVMVMIVLMFACLLLQWEAVSSMLLMCPIKDFGKEFHTWQQQGPYA